MRVLTVVVTHNRSKLLLRCINAINSQSLATNEILIINNGSTDDTEELLIKNNIPFIAQENLGSAGGWNTGINYALENNFDYIWMMVDDGYPDQYSLQNLVNNLDESISCVSSIVVREDMPSRFVFSFPEIDSNGSPKILSFLRKVHRVEDIIHDDSGLIPYAHLFNGALISVSHIRSIGNVNPDYFMYGDEVDYYFRLRSVGRVVSSIQSKHFHPNILSREYSLMRIYFNIKNNLINYQKHYDLKFIRKCVGPFIILMRVTRTNGLRFAVSLLIGKNAIIFYKAIYRGFKLKLGHDFFE